MTYPLPLGFQHTQFCGVVFLRYLDGIAVGWCCFFMLEFQEFACRFCVVFLAGARGPIRDVNDEIGGVQEWS
jgi:hypothetical protein